MPEGAGAGPHRRLVCLGECMVELREQGPRRYAQSFAGDTYNTAVYLQRLGNGRFEVDYASGVGDDAFADDMLQAWQAEGVGQRLVRRIEARGTGLYSIRTDPAGERRFSYWRESSAARAYFLAGTSPLEDAADAIDLLYLSGISLAVMEGALPERLPRLFERLHAGAGRMAFDNNYRPRLWPSAAAARAAFDSVYASADIAFVTLDDEAALRPELSPAQLLELLFALPCAEVIVKRGARSTLLRHRGEVVEAPTVAVAKVVDTTAAGDSFAAAYLASRLTGLPPLAAALAGNRLAATVIQHPGAIIAPEFMPAASG